MEINFYKSTGISLILGSILAISTMVLHPSGGSIEHIIKISGPLKFTHILAIFCLPFILFGFYGLMHKLTNTWKLSVLAFIFIAFGLFAAMLAALFNGLAIPYFLEQYAGNFDQNMDLIEPIMNYGFAINKALDYVFIAGLCSAIAIYSFLIVRTKKLPKWIGYFGIALLVLTIIGMATNFAFTTLLGFRLVVFSIAGWILFSGISLIQSKKQPL